MTAGLPDMSAPLDAALVAKGDAAVPAIPAAVPGLAAATTTQVPPAAPVPVAALPALAIAVATDPGTGQIDLRLSPEELGGVRMQIHCDGSDLRVLIVAERSETLDLLRRNGAALLSEFADAGFGRTTLDFAQGGPAGGGVAAGPAHPDAAESDPADPLPDTWSAPAAASGHLDLRL